MRPISPVRFVVSAALFSSLMISAPATAAPAANAAEDHNIIIVTGEKQRKKKINNFIKSAIRPTGDQQYARFSAPVCPVSMGFNAEYNKVIVDRMRAVAKAAGVRAGKKGCEANMAVIAMKESPDFIGDLRNKYPSIFGKMSLHSRDKLMKGPGPAYAWNTVATRQSGGAVSSGSSLQTASVGSAGDDDTPTFSGANSRINRAVQKDVNMSIVVIEKRALLGVNLRQIADYASMRLLASTDEPSKTRVSERSVLTLFSDRADGYEAPQSVTAWDLALLKALYSTKNNVSASMQRSAMSGIFEQKLLEIAEAADKAEERQN